MISQVNVNALEDEEMLDANNDTEENTAPSSNPVQDIDAASQDKAQLEAMFDDDDDEDFPSSNEAPALYVKVWNYGPYVADVYAANHQSQLLTQIPKS